jgi:hypothetical protein
MPDFFVGGRYIQERGNWVREIEAIHGDDIHWRDKVGDGRCSRQSFARWLGKGSLAPDSPPPPPRAKRSKPITEEVIERVRNDITMMHKLSELTIEPGIADDQQLATVFLWSLRTYINSTEKAAEDLPGHIRKRVFTRIDANAALVQQAVISLCELLKRSSAIVPAERASLLLKSLSDGLESVNRLRGSLEPHLGQ